MVSPKILRLPTASLYGYLRLFRRLTGYRRFRVARMVAARCVILMELGDRARFVDVAAYFDGYVFVVPQPLGPTLPALRIPPEDFDGYAVLRKGMTPR